MLYPLIFQPIFKERIWGGRKLEEFYRKQLPAGQIVGESWEISDRPGDASVIKNGSLAGKDLHWVMAHHAEELLGRGSDSGAGRFPLLIKLLDAQQTLSLQVHPPASRAKELGGEPKTELWYVAAAQPGAELFVGLKRGMTRAEFEAKIDKGAVAECFHRIPVRAGDAMFLPSGRVHALGAGLVIFEIQQNSDTTYRVFDWNRVDAAGRPRQLHLPESMASIDFGDFEPALVSESWQGDTRERKRVLADDPLFRVALEEFAAGVERSGQERAMRIMGVVEGLLTIRHSAGSLELGSGEFCLVPASVKDWSMAAGEKTRFLSIGLGGQD